MGARILAKICRYNVDRRKRVSVENRAFEERRGYQHERSKLGLVLTCYSVSYDAGT